MKKVLGILFLAMLSLMVSCKKDSPKEVVAKFFQAIGELDKEKAQSLSKESAAMFYDSIDEVKKASAEDLKEFKEKVGNIKILNETVDGDKAVVTVMESAKDNVGIECVKEGGSWKVVGLSQETLNKLNKRIEELFDQTTKQLRVESESITSLANEVRRTREEDIKKVEEQSKKNDLKK